MLLSATHLVAKWQVRPLDMASIGESPLHVQSCKEADAALLLCHNDKPKYSSDMFISANC